MHLTNNKKYPKVRMALPWRRQKAKKGTQCGVWQGVSSLLSTHDQLRRRLHAVLLGCELLMVSALLSKQEGGGRHGISMKQAGRSRVPKGVDDGQRPLQEEETPWSVCCIIDTGTPSQ